jgi:tRNA(Ile)-lysidine synthase
MANKLENIVDSSKLLDVEKTILVGVSGGADSIVLAHLLHKTGYNIAVAHCHFNLRGKDADDDQEFSKKFAKKLNVPFFTVKFETQTYADTRKVSIQMAARNLRYFWFEKICNENHYSQIAVGTHLTDNIETFLFNATKGTGLNGLRGIKPKNKKVVRPLLQVTKEDIYTYAKSEGLEWREDVSNQSIKYHRNKIRHKILPVLKEINPNLEATFQRNFKRLSRLDSFVQQEVDALWNSWVKDDNKEFHISISDLKSNSFSDVVLTYKLQPLGFNISQIDDLLHAITGQPGAIISSKDYHIYIDREEIFVQQKRFFSIPNQYLITEFLGEITKPLTLKFKDHHAKDFTPESDKNSAYFDFDTLRFPLTLRKWEKGDRIKPFGMKGSKKVSDLLIDAKIPLHKKEDIWVLLSKNEICWVVGIRSSESFKIVANTERVYSIELK